MSWHQGLVRGNGSGLFCCRSQFILSLQNKIQLSLILSSESHLIWFFIRVRVFFSFFLSEVLQTSWNWCRSELMWLERLLKPIRTRWPLEKRGRSKSDPCCNKGLWQREDPACSLNSGYGKTWTQDLTIFLWPGSHFHPQPLPSLATQWIPQAILRYFIALFFISMAYYRILNLVSFTIQ